MNNEEFQERIRRTNLKELIDIKVRQLNKENKENSLCVSSINTDFSRCSPYVADGYALIGVDIGLSSLE